MKYRLRFDKSEEIKYIGHLDLLKTFQRAIKRVSLPVAYSKGFNPHQIISFACPLALGHTSAGEYCDIELTQCVPEESIINKLNLAMPCGIVITNAVAVEEKSGGIMAIVDAALYEVALDLKPEVIEKNLPQYMALEEIMIMKKTKKSNKLANIREDILDLKNVSSCGQGKLYMFLATGSRRNLKPSLVAESFYVFAGEEFDKYKIKYKRTDLLKKSEEGFVSLDSKVN